MLNDIPTDWTPTATLAMDTGGQIVQRWHRRVISYGDYSSPARGRREHVEYEWRDIPFLSSFDTSRSEKQ